MKTSFYVHFRGDFYSLGPIEGSRDEVRAWALWFTGLKRLPAGTEIYRR